LIFQIGISSFNHSLHIQLALDAEFFDALAQHRARDADKLRGAKHKAGVNEGGFSLKLHLRQ